MPLLNGLFGEKEMANKQDVINAFYEGICVAANNVAHTGAVGEIVDGLNADELQEFLETENGSNYTHLFDFDGKRVIAAV